MSQSADVDVNEILLLPTRQEHSAIARESAECDSVHAQAHQSMRRRGTLRYWALSILVASSCMKMPCATAQATGDAQVRVENSLAAHFGVDDSIGIC